MKKAILPIHQKWVEKIFAGEKTVEIRTRWNTDIERVYIYETAPVSVIVGHFDVAGQTFGSGQVLFDRFGTESCLSLSEIEKYFTWKDGRPYQKCGYAIKIINPVRYNTPIYHKPIQSYVFTDKCFEDDFDGMSQAKAIEGMHITKKMIEFFNSNEADIEGHLWGCYGLLKCGFCGALNIAKDQIDMTEDGTDEEKEEADKDFEENGGDYTVICCKCGRDS